jgi:histidine triad (HIT) family protein
VSTDCIFCDIIAGDIPANKVYEDDHLIAFKDINPQAPVHLLIVPKEHIPTFSHLQEDHATLLAKLFLLAARLAAEQGVAEKGYRLVINCNRLAGQEVFHLHVHLLGGRQFTWPPG